MKKTENNLNFTYKRKRIKKVKILPSLCRDYTPNASSGACTKAETCKYATYQIEGYNLATCYGGTKMSEREDRRTAIKTKQEK